MSKPIQKVPVAILNGFLGSGKTTLLKSLLSQAARQDLHVCTIVNDMSDLDVDGDLIAGTEFIGRNKERFESISSCVLSSKKGLERLDATLTRMLSNDRPDLVVIETSGSCHPMPLVEYFGSRHDTSLHGVLTLVDCAMLAHDYEYGHKLIPTMQQNLSLNQRDTTNLLVEQIMFCSHLALTKADRIEANRVQEIANAIHPINPFVSIMSVLRGKLSLDELMQMPAYDHFRVAQLITELQPALNLEADEDRPYDLATRVIKDDRPFHPQRLWDACHQHLDQKTYRSKGFFWLPGRSDVSLLWNQAAGSIGLELVGYWRAGVLEADQGRLSDYELNVLKERLATESGRFGDRHCNITVIGDDATVDIFTGALERCFLTEKEIEYWQSGGEFDDPWPRNIVRVNN